MADDASDSVRHSIHDLKDSAAESFNRAAEAGSAAADRVRATFLDALDREPLVLGAIGVAVGAAIGAMLPPTRVERDYLGEASESASDLVSEGIDRAREAASDAYTAARDEADRQGFTSQDKPVAEKIADVAGAAGSELSSVASDAIDNAQEALEGQMGRLRPTQ